MACKVFGSLLRHLFPLLSSSLRFTEVPKVFVGRTKCSQGPHAGRSLPTPALNACKPTKKPLFWMGFCYEGSLGRD